MSIIRVEKREQYVVINMDTAADTSISWEAKGLHMYLLSRPDNWKVYVDHLASIGVGGEKKIRRMLNELILRGYVERHSIRETGKFLSWEYIVYETPDAPKGKMAPVGQKRHAAKPQVAQPLVAKDGLSINDNKLVMNITKKELSIDDWRPRKETIDGLRIQHGIPETFTDEILLEYQIYWQDAGGTKPSWDSAFLQWTIDQWNKKGQQWLGTPGNASLL